MPTLWYKVWYDLWTHKARTLMAMVSIAAGVFTIGAIVGMVDQLLTGMDAAHRAVRPSHFSMYLRGAVEAETADILADAPGVAGLEAIAQVPVRYRAGAGEDWQPGNLVMRRDYGDQRYDVMALKAGAWPDDPVIGVERLSGAFFGLGPGDQVVLDTGDSDKTFAIGGLVRHPFVQPPAFGGRAQFFADQKTMAKFGLPAGSYNQLLVRVEGPYSRERAEEVAGELRSRLGDLGVPVAVTLYQDPERHWGRPFVEGSMLILQLIAAVALALSVALVANTLTGLITQQTDQIGVLKAIGGRRHHVVAAYLPGALIYGAAALVIALPLGMLVAFGATQSFLNLFNIDYAGFTFSPRAVALQVLAALAAPLLAALVPVLRGATLSVREALATYGLGADFGSSALDRAVERLGARLLPTIYAASLCNLFRRKGRLTLTVLVLTIAGVTFLVVMALVASMYQTIEGDTARRGYDVSVGFTSSQSAERVEKVLAAQPGIARQELWLSRNATILRAGERLRDSAGLGVQLIGLPRDSQMYRPLLTEGRWLQPGDGRVVVISEDTANENRLRVGDVITLDLGDGGSDEWQIIGTYRVVFSSDFETESFYAPLAAVESATGRRNQATRAYVQSGAATLAQALATADALRGRLEDANIKVDLYTSSVTLEDREFALNQFGPVVSTLLGLASLLATVGAIGLASALSISVMERTREIGVLRAIGADGRAVTALFIIEGVLQSLLSWAIAVPLAFLIARPLAWQLGQVMLDADLDYAFSWPAVLVWLAVTTGIGVLAALQPARTAARLSVRESLSYA